MLMKRMLTAAVAALLLLTAVACAEPAADPIPEQTAVPQADAAGEPAEEESAVAFGSFTAKALDNSEVTDAVFGNAELTMVNIWATFCGPCLHEMPDLAELAAEYADQKVQIIGVVGDVGDEQGNVTEQELAVVQEKVDDTGADYLHLLPSADLRQIVLNHIYAYPTSVFVDREGNILGSAIVGARSKADWQKAIDAMLKLATMDQEAVDAA